MNEHTVERRQPCTGSSGCSVPSAELAAWAYSNLLNPESPRAKDYPLSNVSLRSQPNSLGIFCPVSFEINSSHPKGPPSSTPIPESVRIHNEMKAVCKKLNADADMVKRYFSHSVIADDLAEAIESLTLLLVNLAGKDATALHRLFGVALQSAIQLEELSFREDSLRLIQEEARKHSMWPVPYSPHPRRRKALDEAMKKIELGKRNFQKLWGARDTGKSIAGKFARRMGLTLWEIHSTPGLKFFLNQQAIGMNADARERHLLGQGWHLWMIRLSQLPELTQASVNAWFEVGWELLRDATAGNVASVPELATLGKSNAEYGRRYATTQRGKSGSQNSRMEGQIRSLLRKAFVSRFGNPV